MSDSISAARELYDQGIRFAALKKHGDAAEAFSKCLEQLRGGAPAEDGNEDEDAKEGDAADEPQEEVEDDPKLAPVLHKYGQELLRHAVATSSALGGGGGGGAAAGAVGGKTAIPSRVTLPDAATSSGSKAGASSGASDNAAGSSSAAPQKKLIDIQGDSEDFNAEDDEDGEEGDGDGEDEDDMDTAFAALDVARQLYKRVLSESEPSLETIDGSILDRTEISQQLANVYTDLGELQLESENFTQATSDFEAALNVLKPVVDPLAASRRLAEAHFSLALALEFHPQESERPRALEQARITHKLVTERRAALVQRRDAAAAAEPPAVEQQDSSEAATSNGKGKGKAVAQTPRMAEDDVRGLTKDQASREIGEVDELLKDLDAKIEELQAALSSGANGTKPVYDAVRQAIDEAFLGGESSNPFQSGSGAAASGAPVNNITTLVKKKKPAAGAATAGTEAAASVSAGKRKAEEVASVDAKKARVEDASAAEA
ncbi:hypothetical protein OC846_001785 [Tilletia horrida]|uniref:Tetratricopeptide SHNi-TPR domain-containing protein n=1 Tax=Tilletia horrida TaxID=155126 RepID=A0AAN6GT90_9BASI|nr:hypothetical protein OC845_001851 [Tilletia horrida]KAK0555272.1 hypothetical protein OC846_001785 [Tilletia horrida]